MSATVLMNLGTLQFSLDGATFDELNRTTAYAWPKQSLIGTTPALQFSGQEADTIILPGRIFPHFRGGLGQVDAMRTLAAQGKPLLLVDGLGSVKGFWVITRVTEGRKMLWPGGAPRLQEFSLELEYYGPNGADTQPKVYPVVKAPVGAPPQARVVVAAARPPAAPVAPSLAPFGAPGAGPFPPLNPVPAPAGGGGGIEISVNLGPLGIDLSL